MLFGLKSAKMEVMKTKAIVMIAKTVSMIWKGIWEWVDAVRIKGRVETNGMFLSSFRFWRSW
jgi:hypothetical protein